MHQSSKQLRASSSVILKGIMSSGISSDKRKSFLTRERPQNGHWDRASPSSKTMVPPHPEQLALSK